MEIQEKINKVGNLELKTGKFVADIKEFDEIARYALNSKKILEELLSSESSILNLIECSAECCPLCKKNSAYKKNIACNGSIEECKAYHLEDISRILSNLKHQDK